MRYREGVDYWVRYVDFPNTASEAVAVSNGDGTFTVYLNTRFPREILEARLRHELRHLEDEHFFRDGLSVLDAERQADGVPTVRTMPGPEPCFCVFRSDALPPDVSFAFYAPYDMRPVARRGALVLCDDRPVLDGDAGLFGWDGATVCGQYHRDPAGYTYLFPVGRPGREAVMIAPALAWQLRCYGRVRTKRPLALPGVHL